MIALDTETERFGVGNQAPRLVCLSVSSVNTGIYHRNEIEKGCCPIIGWVAGFDIVGHNIAYDMAVLARFMPRLLPRIFDAYWQGRIHDTMIRQQLMDIAYGNYMPKAKGRYTLAALAHTYLGLTLDKDTYRLDYGDLIDTPISEWEQGAVDYAIGDAVATRQIAEAQDKYVAERKDEAVFVDAPRQAAWSFAYHLMTCWGMVTDAQRVATLAKQTEHDLDALRDMLAKQGFLNVTKTGAIKVDKHGNVSRNVKKLREEVVKAYGEAHCPRTPSGQPATDVEALSKHPALRIHSDYIHTQKILNTYVRVLQRGVTGVIHGKFWLLETGRRGASDNMQTLPKDAGIRECYRARRGCVLGSIDYNSIELRSWAQVMVNWFGVDNVPMAKLYRDNPDADPHLKFAADFFLGISYEEALARYRDGDVNVKDARQNAKAVNFGIPGGMGPKRFVEHAAKYGYEITEKEARKIKDGFCEVWNARPYFDRVSMLSRVDGFAVQEHSKRVRGGLGYCDMANGFFQALTADGHSRALFMISRECYTAVSSPLYGCRPVNGLHDEIILEMPEAKAHEALARAELLMVQAMQEVCPDVPIRVEGALMTHWSKNAKRKTDAQGRVQVYQTPMPAHVRCATLKELTCQSSGKLVTVL